MIPTANELFVPRFAYKALVKVGLAILPDDFLQSHSMLLRWVGSKEEKEDFPFLDVTIRLDSLTKAPPIVAATVLEPEQQSAGTDLVLVVTAGSICWQLALKADPKDCDVDPTICSGGIP